MATFMIPVRTFLLRLMLFTIPVVLVTALIFGLAVYNGEAMPLQMVIQLQATSEFPLTYFPRTAERRFQYKVMSINFRQPDIIAVGSSRVLQMRSELFNRDPDKFYNAGNQGLILSEVTGIIHAIHDEAMPKILLLEMDQYWFVHGTESLTNNVVDMSRSEDSLLDILPQTKSFWAEVIKDSIPINQILQRQDALKFIPTLGLFTINGGTGYRPDGTRPSDKLSFDSQLIDEKIERSFETIENGKKMYRQSEVIDTIALQELQGILDYLHSKDVLVIGYMPPFAPTIYQQLMDSGQYEYMLQFEPTLTPLFEQYGFAFFDFTDPAKTGTQDRDTWDGWHPSEKITSLIYLHIAEQMPDVFAEYTDISALRDILSQAEDTFIVFPY